MLARTGSGSARKANPAVIVFGFILLLAGGVLVTTGVTGSSLASVVKGAPDHANDTGASGSTATSGSTASTGSTTTQQGSVTAGSLSGLASQHGWDASEVAAWLGVIAKESGGRLDAQNPSSNAYGIAQFINGPSEYAQYGGNATTVQGQLTAMANYIQERYGTPSAALAHENEYHWY